MSVPGSPAALFRKLGFGTSPTTFRTPSPTPSLNGNPSPTGTLQRNFSATDTIKSRSLTHSDSSRSIMATHPLEDVNLLEKAQNLARLDEPGITNDVALLGLLICKPAYKIFYDFCCDEICEENCLFWDKIYALRKTAALRGDVREMRQQINWILEHFIDAEMMNLPAKVVKLLQAKRKEINQHDVGWLADFFNEAEGECFRLLLDAYSRFLKTPRFQLASTAMINERAKRVAAANGVDAV